MEKAAAAQPGSVKTCFGLAIAMQLIGRSDDAIACFEKVLALDPTHYDALVQLGNVKMLKKDAGAAELLFRRAIALRERPT